MAKRFAGFDWKTEEDAFNDGFRRAGTAGAPPIDSQGGDTGHLATYDRCGPPATMACSCQSRKYTNGKLVGTEMMYMDGKFDTAGREGHLQSLGLAGTAEDSRRPEGQAQVLDQQRSGERGLADRLPRHVQRVRPQPLAHGVR